MLTLYQKIIYNAKMDGFPVEEWETSDGGYAVTVWTGVHFKTNYYFDKDKVFQFFEDEEA